MLARAAVYEQGKGRFKLRGAPLLNPGAEPDTSILRPAVMGYYDVEMEQLAERFWRNTFTFFAWLRRGWRGRPTTRAEWRLAALDALGWLLALYAAAGRWLSAIFTVRWDPLGRSRRPIPTRAPRGPRAFTVGAASERERRVVAWFYRWHETPDDDDWRACLALFGLAAVPAHYLLLEGGRSVEVAEIRLGEGGGRGSRTVAYDDATVDGRGGPRVTGPTPIGGLSPARLIKDASAA